MLAHLLKKHAGSLSANNLRRLGNLWLPFIGAGIKIVHVSEDYRKVDVQMKLRWYNRNYVGTHFGGSIYAMTDSFYVIMLINNLGRDYIVWDKSASIDFLKPGRSTLKVKFKLSEEQIQQIRQEADSEGKTIFDLPITVMDESEEAVASVNKTIYVRRKNN